MCKHRSKEIHFMKQTLVNRGFCKMLSLLSVGLLLLGFNQTLEAGSRSERSEGHRRIHYGDT